METGPGEKVEGRESIVDSQSAPDGFLTECERYSFEFTGSGREFFRVWIVNILFTLLTLGIYAAWAKVRTRRYFYANTRLDNHSFDFTANPIAILKGYLIIGIFVVLIGTSNEFLPEIGSVIGIAFYIIIPFLIYKSLRFRAKYSAYRNIHFRFLGTLPESYIAYLLIPFFLPFTLGLLFPYWSFRRKEFFFKNFSYGTTLNRFLGRPGPFYRIYGWCALLSIAAVVAVVVVTMITVVPIFQEGSGSNNPFPVVFFFLPGILFLLFYTVLDQFLYARLNNYCFAQSRLGSVRIESKLRARNLIWIRFSNLVAIFLSIGLLIPWAKVRRIRYILQNINVLSDTSLENFTGSAEPEEAAWGEAAADFFDIEIGL